MLTQGEFIFLKALTIKVTQVQKLYAALKYKFRASFQILLENCPFQSRPEFQKSSPKGAIFSPMQSHRWVVVTVDGTNQKTFLRQRIFFSTNQKPSFKFRLFSFFSLSFGLFGLVPKIENYYQLLTKIVTLSRLNFLLILLSKGKFLSIVLIQYGTNWMMTIDKIMHIV